MAGRSSKQPLYALWNSVEESTSRNDDVDHKIQKKPHTFLPQRLDNFPRQPRNLPGVSCEHLPQTTNPEHSYNVQQQKRNEQKSGRFQKHCLPNLGGVRNPEHTITAACHELKEYHNTRNPALPRKDSKRTSRHKAESNDIRSHSVSRCTPLDSFHEQRGHARNVTSAVKDAERQSQSKNRHKASLLQPRSQSVSSNSCGQDRRADCDTLNVRSQRGAPSERKSTKNERCEEDVRPMAYIRLQNLLLKDSDEILLTLITPRCGFLKLLKSEKVSDSMMSYILIALGKSCKSNLRENVLALVNSVTSHQPFMYYSLQMHMVFLQNKPNDESYETLCHLLQFLKTFVDCQPATASLIMPVLSPMVVKTVEKYDGMKDSPEGGLKEMVNDLVRQTELFIEQHTEKEIIKATAEEKLQLQTPPEDFHEIPVLPSRGDICDYQPFLRPNIVKGKYSSINHYLDVQFRLLREDFVRPLREGIMEYKRMENKGQIRKCGDLRVYLNVHVIGSEFFHGTLVHLLQFDAEKFKKVTWEYSKRFLTGSLLCLSVDNFETTLFATVLQREPQKLKKGLLLIKFEELTENILGITPFLNFVVLETTAYFEAYRHILLALQNITDLPLKKYIIDVEKDIGSPRYVSKDTTYDISPLLLPISAPVSDDFDGLKLAKCPPDVENCHLKSVQILNDSHWPSEDKVGLDASQLIALKAALTTEFSVIQGPPGTGKTYLGLRIVQLLLHNASKWNTSKSPILIVCYTNHALDQFLEGILNFTQKVVRIGGRCNSEKVEPHLLRNVRSKMRMSKSIPRHIFYSIKEKTMHLNILQREVNETERLIEKGSKTILGEEILKPHMKSTHYSSLKSGVMQLCSYPLSGSALDDGHIIYDWLEVRYRGFELGSLAEKVFNLSLNSGEAEVWNYDTHHANDVLKTPEDENLLENEGGSDDDDGSEAGDIEFIEAMREVDEDYSGIDFDLREAVVEDYPLYEGEWKTQQGAKKRKKFIEKMLRKPDMMSSEDANKVVDIWRLPFLDRWRLYRYWLNSYVLARQADIMETQEKVCQEYKQLCEMKLAEDLHALRDLEIVGMTTTGAAKYRKILQTLDPCIVVVEEAAEILESHIVTSLGHGTQHLILIGDHQQLRPSPTVYQLTTKYNLDISLFERMIKNDMKPYVLSIQHRMRPSIAALLVPHIYAELKNDVSVMKFENIKGVSSNMFFLNHSYCEGKDSDSASKVNSHEATFLVEFCRYLLLQGYMASQITILTAYSGQLILLKKLTKKPLFKGVRVTVVDNFQGEENDIILLSFVRSNEEGIIGFLKTANRVCVSLSRARKGMYCIGNFMLLAEQSKLWKDIMITLEAQGAVGDALELCCQNHPNCSNMVASAGDFKVVPEGGCTRPCEYRLECGHTCTRMCHPYDPLHEKFQCRKVCGKVACTNGHICQKQCYQECGSCCVEVFKIIPQCKHEVLVPCYLSPSLFRCTSPCSKTLSCGHLCTKTCGEFCVEQCHEKITVPSPCGHAVNVLCFQAKSLQLVLYACHETCKAELDCGHLCTGTCSECYQGRLHLPCKNPCRRVLVCGHQCTSECSQSCPPCKRKCENRCIHSKCPKKCGVPCNPCMEKCEWKCVHKECTKRCSERCDRSPCNRPCPKLLSCKHNCVGLCGEPCPVLCSICDGEQLRELFFGTEDEEDSRFIMLEDCKHIFEVSGLTQWMKLDSNQAGEIQMKYCPKCKTVIRRNLRFGNTIKACLSDVLKVKSVVFGETKQIKQKKKILLRQMETCPLSDKLVDSINNILSEYNISIWDVERCENIINIALNLQEIFTKRQLDIYHLINSRDTKTDIWARRWKGIDVTGLIDCICETAALIDKFLHEEHKTATLQQMKEIQCELQRLKLSATLWHILQKNESKAETSSGFHDTFTGILNSLLRIRFNCFTETEELRLNKSLENLMKMCNFSVLGISDTEKKLILRAMNLSVGHWYQCPNGHVYCITECGGAMEISKCNECGATIGGQRHRLRDDNRVATDMDGARRDAWSLAANVQNYDLIDLR